MSRVAVLVVAAGRGERAGGGVPKQYRPVAGVPMLRRSLDAFLNDARVVRIQTMIGEAQEALFAQAAAGLALPEPRTGGAQRQDTVRLGLELLASDAPDFVLIHDAARPLVSRALIDRIIAALESGAAAAVPLLAVADTLRRREPDERWSTIPRDNLYRAQTPQGFRFAAILAAHRAHAKHEVTDDMALAELAGLKIQPVEGEEANIKITKPEDFMMAERLLDSRAGETRSAMGFDAHRFVAGDHVWLCGIRIAHDQGLEGHSDADAGLHALTDALLGAIGAGDIGQHFPPTDPRWRGAASWKFLAHAAALVREQAGRIVHCDVTLICERPKIGPHRDAMRARIAEILAVETSRVSVKATTTEGMGFTGRKEGLAAQAIATIAV